MWVLGRKAGSLRSNSCSYLLSHFYASLFLNKQKLHMHKTLVHTHIVHSNHWNTCSLWSELANSSCLVYMLPCACMHLWSELLVPTLKYQTLTVISLHPLTSIIQIYDPSSCVYIVCFTVECSLEFSGLECTYESAPLWSHQLMVYQTMSPEGATSLKETSLRQRFTKNFIYLFIY